MIFEILLVKYIINNIYFDISCKVCSWLDSSVGYKWLVNIICDIVFCKIYWLWWWKLIYKVNYKLYLFVYVI